MNDVEQILSSPEGRTLEFKRDLSSLKPILKTIVAFANTAGGILVIGRDDEGNIHGVDNVFINCAVKLGHSWPRCKAQKLVPLIIWL